MEAYHYLLKPVDADSLFSLLDKVQGELSEREEQGFVLKDRRGIVWISFAQLEYVEVINKTVSFHLTDGSVRQVNTALAEVEKLLLPREEFIKTHRAFLVNLGHVRDTAASYVAMKNGDRVPISRKRHNQVHDTYLHFLLRKEESPDVGHIGASDKEKKQVEGLWRILLVDDDPGDRSRWADILCSHGCIVYQAENGEEALALAESRPCDCVILDVKLSGEDGFAICRKLKKQKDIPVIFLSCLTEADKQMEGFLAGGMDYITKDTPEELFWAKIQAHISLVGSNRTRLSYGPLLLDMEGRRAFIYEKELLLTPMEFDLLWQLSEHAGQIVTPEEIFGMTCGVQSWDDGQTMQVHMSRLRRKLEKACSTHCFIETVWGQGYRFVLPDH